MQSGWLARLFFAVVTAVAVAGVVSGTACTRWGQPGPTVPTLAPLSSIFVNPNTGSDTSGNGSQTNPYRTLTKAVEVLDAAKSLSPNGVMINLSGGDYDASKGEKFPIVMLKSASITGSNYGTGVRSGSFVNGMGEDTTFEKLVHAPPHSVYTTLEVVPGVSVSVNGIYVGSANISLPGSRAFYVSFNDLGTVTATATFAAGIASRLRDVNGVLVAGGSFTCASCSIKGNDFGIGALSVPGLAPSPSPSGTGPPSGLGPTIALSHSVGDATIAAKVVGILTDGSVNVTAANQAFNLGAYAFSDAFPPVVRGTLRGTLDFGGGGTSNGGNTFIGQRVTEIAIGLGGETVSALDDTWNSNQQGANRSGRYPRTKHFASGVSGRNVTIRHGALGSTVTVGPAPAPTPSSSPSSPSSPSPSPT
ncbi:MAG: DUF1565 domain-containing protein [Candidatus Cybelea sp.]